MTVEAVERLLRSRLRRHLLARMVAIERRARHDDRADVLELVLDSESSIEVAADAMWITALGAWTHGRVDSPLRWLRACIRVAVTAAVEKSADFIGRWWGEYPAEQVHGWIEEYVAGVDEGELLGDRWRGRV